MLARALSGEPRSQPPPERAKLRRRSSGGAQRSARARKLVRPSKRKAIRRPAWLRYFPGLDWRRSDQR